MAEYLNRAELQEALQRKKPVIGSNARFTEGYNDAILRIKSMVSKFPAADVAPVAYGQLIDTGHYGPHHMLIVRCTHCKKEYEGGLDDAFCAKCGAKMDGGKA